MEKLLAWVGPARINPQEDQQLRLEQCTKNTAEWIFNDEFGKYQTWKTERGWFLWIHGDSTCFRLNF
jgi:hypothetical protein